MGRVGDRCLDERRDANVLLATPVPSLPRWGPFATETKCAQMNGLLTSASMVAEFSISERCPSVPDTVLLRGLG